MPDQIVEPLQVNQKQAAEMLGYSLPFLRKIKDLPVIRKGASVRYPVEALREWQRQQMELQQIPARLKEQTDRLQESVEQMKEQMRNALPEALSD